MVLFIHVKVENAIVGSKFCEEVLHILIVILFVRKLCDGLAL